MKWQVKISRDVAILIVALLLAIYEVTIGGGRVEVLTFIAALLASPLVIRADEYRREKKNDERDSSSH